MSPSPQTGFRIEGERLVFEGSLVRVAETSVASPDGELLRREVIRHPGAVVIVPLEDDGRVVLVRQYRAAVGADLVELPAGKLDQEGEDPLDAAQRELAEEVGRKASSMRLLARFYNSPGFCDEFSHLYLATGLSEVERDPHGAEERHCEVLSMPLQEALSGIASGWVQDAKTIAGLTLAALSLSG